MKKLIFIFCLFFALNSGATTVYYDSSLQASYVNIVPVLNKRTDLVNCTKLYVSLVSDDLSQSCTLKYELRADDNTLMDKGILVIDDGDYEDWDGSNTYPFLIAMNRLKLSEQK